MNDKNLSNCNLMHSSVTLEGFEDAFLLAKEQMVYCEDIFFQGTMTVKRLAETLVDSSVWYFWWD